MIDSGDYNFSFSGLKSHVINLHHNMVQRGDAIVKEDFCRSFQEAVTDVLCQKTKRAAHEFGVTQVIVAGGVAANRGLRAKMTATLTDVPVFFPAMKYCTDNAAMIAAAGYFKYRKVGLGDDLYLNGDSRLALN
jgi:N6-L-threonylcarbamoyladenine synthase